MSDLSAPAPAAPAATSIVSATGLTRVYGTGQAEVRALDGIDVEFPKGEFAAIMGPSGSGKSTLMHCLAGLDRPTTGTVIIDGVDLSELDDAELTELRRDNVGFIFQFFNLLPVLDARENMLLPLKLAGREPEPGRLEELAEAVGMTDRLDHRPSELSGGQQQRIAIARALLSAPAVIFADEPTGNLDSESSQEVLAMLRRAVDELGQTVVMVTHDAVAASNADRILVLVDGKIVRDDHADTPEQVLDLMKQVAK